MPFKAALAVALSVVLAAPVALAAPTSPASSSSSAPSHAPHKAAKPSKARPSSPKSAAIGKRKHVIDTKPDAHGAAISMSKPVDMPKVDAKKGEPKKADVKHAGKKREARQAASKKNAPKAGNDKAAPVLAAAISADLPPLPAVEVDTKPEATNKKDHAPVQGAAPAGGRSLLARGKKAPCMSAPVHVLRGTEDDEVSLTKCDGSPAPGAAEKMAFLLRPGHTDKAAVSIDTGLIERLGKVTEKFSKPGVPTKVSVVSGSRPSSAGSYHASGRAMDFRIEGVKNEELVAFCKTLNDTGCGYYPNSSFVHMDVRDTGTGHVAWIDASGPGESPRYVSQWPPPASAAPAIPAPADETPEKKEARAMIEDLLATIEKELPQVRKDGGSSSPAPAPTPDAAITAPLPAPAAAPTDAAE